ncbi:MAG: cytochrome C [Planctomycetota bacterium]
MSLPKWWLDLVEILTTPYVFFILSSFLLYIFLKGYRFFTKLIPGLLYFLSLTLFFGISMTNEQFRSVVLKSDNVPIIALIFITSFFVWFGLRQAAINDRRIESNLPPIEGEEKDRYFTWPDLVFIEFIATIIGTVILILWSIFLKAPLEQPADPAKAPNPAKAPWYFLGLQEMLVYFDPWIAGVVLPTLIIVGLCAIPYIDTNPKGKGYYTFKERKLAITLFLYGFVILWILLIFQGTFLRGPNWNFFSPYEKWDVTKAPPLNNVDLAEYVYLYILNRPLPENVLERELFGIILVVIYFTLLPFILAKTVFKKVYEELGFTRYSVFIFLFLCMAGMVLKMFLRWTINLKYLIFTGPPLNFNI